MTRPLLILLLALFPIAAGAAVYKWQDASGRWHYSDTPVPGADQVELPPVQVYSPPPVPAPPAASRPATQEQEPALTYARVEILSPAPEQTIRNGPGEVGVAVGLEPGLRSGHRLRLLLDGVPVAEPVGETAFTLVNVDRGAHTLSVEILDSRGQVIARGGPQTFYMHRPSRLH